MKTLRTRAVAGALLSAVSGAGYAALFADTNGDGVTDTITTGTSGSGAPYVQIFHPNTGTSTFYNFGIGVTNFQLVGTTNTNSFAGQEVIVRADSPATGPAVSVIEDRIGARRQYNFGTGLTSFGIVSISHDTDNQAGNEIVVFLSGATGPSVRIIDDAASTTRQYNFGTGLTYFEISGITDTNGMGGAEVITRFDSGASSRSIRIIDDTAATTRQYNVSGNNFSIYGIHDYDGSAGAEVCYFLTSAFRMIVDRTGSIVTVPNCN